MSKTSSTSTPSTAVSSTESPLLQLAFEIRRDIYALVLPKKLSVHVQAMWPYPKEDAPAETKPSTPTSLWSLDCGGALLDKYGSRLAKCEKCHIPNNVYERVKDKRSDSDFVKFFDSMAVDLSLLKTCRQVREEASRFFFRSNHFVFMNEMQCFDLLTSPGLDFSAMRSMTLFIEPSRYQPLYCNMQEDTDIWFDHIREITSKLSGITELTVYGVMYSEPPGAYDGEPLPPSDEVFMCTLQMLSKLPLQKASAELGYAGSMEYKEWWDYDEDENGDENVIFDSDAAKLLLGDWDNLETQVAQIFRQRQKVYGRIQTEML